MNNRGWFRNGMLGLGLAFLYIPILSMMVFSLNNSRLVTVWDAENSPTLRWYVRLLENDQLLGAAWISVQIAAMTARVSGRFVVGHCSLP
jgi:putrescine transport system permease protein